MILAVNILDIMSFLLLVGMFLYLVISRERWKEHKLLGVILVLVGIFYAFDYASDVYLWAWLGNVTLYTIFGPLLFTHLRKILSIHPQPALEKAHLIFPAINFLILIGVELFGWEEDLFYDHPLFYLQIFAVLMSMIYYGAHLLLIHQKASWQPFSLSPNLIKWAGSLMLTYAGFTLLALSNWFLFPVLGDTDAIYLVDSLGSFLLLGYIAIQARRLKIIQVTSTSSSIDTEAQRWLDLFEKIDRQVQDLELFLNPKLKVEDLAKVLNTNSRYVSRAINVGHGESFTHYINSLRINRFKESLSDKNYRRMTLDALAQECGFHSRSSLHRFFRQVEGMTPSEYRETLPSQDD